MHKRFIWILLVCLVCLASISITSRAEEAPQEYQLKAAFLVNFARFITWPEQVFSPNRTELVLCVAGLNPFGDELNAVHSKKIQGSSLRIAYIDSLKDTGQCHLLYVSKSEEGDIGRLAAAVGKRPVVTVSDIPGFALSGGSIEFVMKRNRLSFIINNTSLKQLGIQAGASMLDLAAEVR